MQVVGRFAPSPTGPLHFGSLVAAVASYVDAKSRGGKWLVRIEDLDPLRTSQEYSDEILKCLEAHGLQWDDEILYQSTRGDAYQYAFDMLKKSNHVYACNCSRKQLETAQEGRLGPVYTQHCLNHKVTHFNEPLSWRFRMKHEQSQFTDRIVGTVKCNTQQEIGDVIVWRKENLAAYHLASVVDDAYQGITDVVRGEDLLYCSFPQIELRCALGYAPVTYSHVPVVKNENGEKLSKQTNAPALDFKNALENVYDALAFLKIKLPSRNDVNDVHTLLHQALLK